VSGQKTGVLISIHPPKKPENHPPTPHP
jgi:hypothetical protein